MGKLRYLAVVLFVLGVTFFTSWLLRTLDETPLIKTGRINREPDYFFEEFVATAKDPQGKITYRLEATQLQHFPYNDSMSLTKPYIEFFSESKQAWQTWAERGVFFEKDQTVNLNGQVRIHRAADKINPSITLLTDAITMDMRKNVARTSSEVQITSGEDVLNATGMMVDLKSGRVELHSKVQGKYEVPKR